MGLYFEDFKVGEVYESEPRTITEADIVAFSTLTGDRSGVHTDARQAEASVFGRQVAHGSLVISLAMGLVQRLGLFEGTAIAPLDLQWKFSRPAYLGDTIQVRLTIVKKEASSNPGRGTISRRFEVLNQDGITIQEGTSVLLIKTKVRTLGPRE